MTPPSGEEIMETFPDISHSHPSASRPGSIWDFSMLPHRESWGRNVARSLRSLAGVFMPFNQFPYCILMYYVFMMESTDFLLTIFISFRWKCVKISNTLSCLLSQNFNSKKQKSLFVINLMLGGSYPVGGWGHFVTPLNRSNLCPHTNGTCN